MLHVTRVSLIDHGIEHSLAASSLSAPQLTLVRPPTADITRHHRSTAAQNNHPHHIISRYQATRCNIPIHVTFTCTCNVHEMDSRGNSAGPQQIGGAAAYSQSRPVPAAEASSATANSSADATHISPVAETIVVENQRRKVNVTSRNIWGKLSPLRKYVTLFSPALKDGKNIICRV